MSNKKGEWGTGKRERKKGKEREREKRDFTKQKL